MYKQIHHDLHLYFLRPILHREPLALADDFENNIRFVNRGAKNYNMPVNEMEMPASNLHDIECEINKEYSVQCRRDGNEVYMPFSFIEKYFEVWKNLLCCNVE